MTTASAGSVAVVVAVKRLDQAKSRLGPVGDRWREALVLAMLDDVLSAVREAGAGSVTLISADSSYDEVARRHGVERIADAGGGYNAAVVTALALPRVAGAAAALVVPADLPTLRPRDVLALCEALMQVDVLLVASPDGGTSVLGLHPPDAMRTAFGPDSAAAHAALARASGLRLAEPALRHLIDVDDAEALRVVAADLGPATAAVLAELTQSGAWPPVG